MDRGDTNQAHGRIAARLTGSILFRQICAFVCVDIVIFLLIVLVRTDAEIFTGYASVDAELTDIVLWLQTLPIFDLTGYWALLTIGVVEALALVDSAIKIRKPIRKQL
ncbi:MAG: hypothetical protein LBN12_04895, partial [Clostridiales Family XIII bacterium]|nr:hypothetical protein [Clostridiales Family XIII bacterium]